MRCPWPASPLLPSCATAAAAPGSPRQWVQQSLPSPHRSPSCAGGGAWGRDVWFYLPPAHGGTGAKQGALWPRNPKEHSAFGDLERELLPSPSTSRHLSPLHGQSREGRQEHSRRKTTLQPARSWEQSTGLHKSCLVPPPDSRGARPLPHRPRKTQLQALLCHPSPPSNLPLGYKMFSGQSNLKFNTSLPAVGPLPPGAGKGPRCPRRLAGMQPGGS